MNRPDPFAGLHAQLDEADRLAPSHLDDLLDMLDDRELPDPCPDGVPCCDSYAMFGPSRCTCWEPIYNTGQATPLTEMPTEARAAMCADCAFRPGSPERTDSDHAVASSTDLLRCVVDTRQDFSCHDGLRYGIGYRHPNGLEVVLTERDGVTPYHPPIIAGESVAAMNRLCTVCRPGVRCQPCHERSIAVGRMFRLCRLWGPDARRDRVAYAEQVTSMNDARAALCLAIGIPVDSIDPTTGHDRRGAA